MIDTHLNNETSFKISSYNKLKRHLIFLLCIILLVVSFINILNYSVFRIDLLDNVNVNESKILASSNQIKPIIQRTNFFNSIKNKRRLSQKSEEFLVPKKAWFFNIQSKDQLPHKSFSFPFKELYQLNRLNNVQIAQQNDFIVNYVTNENYSEYLTEESALQINKVIRTLENRLHKKEATKMFNQLVNETHDVTRRLITYFLMKDHGGVFIDDRVTLVESLESMLSDLSSNRDINVGNRFYGSVGNDNENNGSGKCIGFYNDKFSSMKEKVDFLVREYEVEKSIVKFPNVEDYFIACEKNSLFIEKLVKVYVDLLINEKDSEWFKKLDKSEKLIGKTDINKIYEHGHFIATHIILQQQQQRIEEEKQGNKNLAIDTLSLLTINARLGPTKLQSQFVLFGEKTISYLTKLTLQQIQLLNGEVKYVFALQQKVVNLLMNQFGSHENSTHFVVRESFVNKYWFSRLRDQQNLGLIQKLGKIGSTIKEFKVMKQNLKKSSKFKYTKKANNLFLPPLCDNCHHRLNLNTSAPQWQSLQRNIWVIWDNGIEKSNFIVEMCFQNLKLSAKNSNFTINLVSKDNVKDFISEELITKINSAINNAAFDLSNQAISDLWRLALVYEHGGVYFDASTFQIEESFEWILNVTQFPRQLIWNRYEQEPEVFMLWNAYYGSPLDWHYDHEHHTRSQWHLSYENNFIAAAKGSNLIKQWLEAMMQWIQLPFDIVWKEMESVQMTGYSWTYDNKLTGAFRYLTAMDSLKYVIGRKQKLLRQQNPQKKAIQTASHYYKLWSMPGQMLGQQKFRGQTNYQNRDYRLDDQNTGLNNIYRYKYAFKNVEKALGPALFQVKFFGYDLIYMNKYVNDFYSEMRLQGQKYDLRKLDEAFHPRSVLVEKLFTRFPEKTLYCLQKYNEINQIRLRTKAANKIWTY